MDSSITFLTRVYISFFVARHDVTHHPAYQPELLSGQYVCLYVYACINVHVCVYGCVCMCMDVCVYV
jgi:hypothetical protein